jgi:acyl-CoA reductase-like NAD-dependent aldehyde dehydrogenase
MMYEGNRAVQVHGPGRSKIVIGEYKIVNWKVYLDVMVASISDNGGRSCINASAVIVPKYGKEIATALAERLGPVMPTTSEDENARLAGFANVKMADYIDSAIDNDLKTPGAEDMTAKFRDGPRKVEFHGGTFLRPSIIWCSDNKHPLANREFLCPYASVVHCPQSEVLKNIGYTLACSAITKDPAFIRDLEAFTEIDRLNIGPVSTMKISWDQPHEGNMFEFLWQRRSIEYGW